MPYEERFYRQWVASRDLVSFEVRDGESDLLISADGDLTSTAQGVLAELRGELESFVEKEPQFLGSLTPVAVSERAPLLVREMAGAAEAYDVGPMAAVAGAIAEAVGRRLLDYSSQVIVENGGDIYMKAQGRRSISVYGGEDSPFSGKLRIAVEPGEVPLGICTSSAIVGHSLSFGKADAVVACARSTALADAAATAICNGIKTPGDISGTLEREKTRGLLEGLLICLGRHLGAWGCLQLE